MCAYFNIQKQKYINNQQSECYFYIIQLANVETCGAPNGDFFATFRHKMVKILRFPERKFDVEFKYACNFHAWVKVKMFYI